MKEIIARRLQENIRKWYTQDVEDVDGLDAEYERLCTDADIHTWSTIAAGPQMCPQLASDIALRLCWLWLSRRMEPPRKPLGVLVGEWRAMYEGEEMDYEMFGGECGDLLAKAHHNSREIWAAKNGFKDSDEFLELVSLRTTHKWMYRRT